MKKLIFIALYGLFFVPLLYANIVLTIEKDDEVKKIELVSLATLGDLRHSVQTAYALTDDQMHRFTFTSAAGQHGENALSWQTIATLGIKDGMHLIMKKLDYLRITMPDVGSWYVTYPGSNTTICDLAATVADITGVPLNDQSLIFGLKDVLEEPQITLENAKIKAGATLFLHNKNQFFIVVRKENDYKGIVINRCKTLSELKQLIAQSFAIPLSTMHAYTLESDDGTHYEEYEHHTQLPLKPQMQLTLKPRSVLNITSQDGRSWYLTHPGATATPNELIEKVKVVTGCDPLHTSFFSDSVIIEPGKTAQELGLTKHPIQGIRGFLYYNKIPLALVMTIALSGFAYGIRCSDWFGRFWYHRLGNYKKLTGRRTGKVLETLVSLCQWRAKKWHAAHTNDQRAAVQAQFETRKERIMMPYSLEDRAYLEEKLKKRGYICD